MSLFTVFKNKYPVSLTTGKLVILPCLFLVSCFLVIPHPADAAVSNLGLVGYWSFNEGTGSYIDDFSGNNNRGTTTGSTAASWTTGKLGKALSFDGANDFVGIPNSTSLQNGKITVSAWYKKPTWGVSGAPIFNIRPQSNDSGITLETTQVGALGGCKEGCMAFYAHINGSFRLFSTSGWAATSTWVHVTATYDGADMKIYRNGVQVSTSTAIAGSITTAASAAVSMGKNNANGTRLWNGEIDEVRVYNRALSASEIRDLYKAGAQKFAAPPTNLGLVGYWSFNEGTSTIATDFSGKGNSGTLTSMAFPATATSGWGNGKLGKALNFDGVDDFVSGGNVGNVNTISYWVKSNSNSNGGIELNANQYITDNAIPEGMVSPTTYIDGAVQASLYGSELVTNGDMEANSTWVNWPGNPPTSQAQSSEQAYRGTYSWKVVTSSGWQGAEQTLSVLSASTQYKLTGWMYTSSGVAPYMNFAANNADVININTTVSAASWNYYTGYGTTGLDVTTNPRARLLSNNGAMTSYFDDMSLKQVLTRYPITDTNWHHVVITTGTAISASAVKIGKGGATYMNGLIDDVRVYNRALSAAEVSALYNSGAAKHTTPTNLGLVGYWSFNEGTSTIATDFSGKGNSGTLTSMAFPATATSGWGNGKLGKALNFDGANDLVQVTDSNPTIYDNLSAMTLSAWIKPDTVGENARGRIFDKANGTAPTNGWILFLSPAFGGMTPNFYVDGLTDMAVQSGTIVATSTWSHVALTWNGTHTCAGNALMYINGVQVATPTCTDLEFRLSDAAETLKIGNDKSSARTFDGSLDDVRIYNRALTATEIQTLYKSGATRMGL